MKDMYAIARQRPPHRAGKTAVRPLPVIGGLGLTMGIAMAGPGPPHLLDDLRIDRLARTLTSRNTTFHCLRSCWISMRQSSAARRTP